MSQAKRTYKGIDLSNIIRFDYDHTHGWQVRMQYDNKTYNRFFADGQHGGKVGALHEAAKYRDQLYAWRKSRPPVDRTANTPESYETRSCFYKARNSIGVTGVSRRDRPDRSPFYEASAYVEKGNQDNFYAATSKYGELGAFLRAVQWRRAKMKAIHGDRWDEDHFNQQVDAYIDTLKPSKVAS